MSQLVFATKDLRRCIEHALKSTKWSMGYSESEPGPALFLVHDDGVYCMSNGEPGDPAHDGTVSLYCAYAKSCDPEKDADCWENSRALVGGNDFAETIPITADWLKACDICDEFHVSLDDENIHVRFHKKEAPVSV